MGKALFTSDLYSLGVTCIHLLTQMPPFDLVDSSEGSWVWRDYLSDPINKHLGSVLDKSINKHLGSVLDKLLERGTRRRYTSASAVLHDLTSPLLHYVLNDISSTESSHLTKNGKSQSLKSKFVAATVSGIVGVSALAGMGYVAIPISERTSQPIIVQAPQPQKLAPVKRIPPLPNQQAKPIFSQGKPIETLSPVIKSFTAALGLLAVITGMGTSVLDYQQRGDFQRGVKIIMAGLIISLLMNIVWDILIADSASVTSTFTAPIHPTKKNQISLIK